jgi:hypothetical protein
MPGCTQRRHLLQLRKNTAQRTAGCLALHGNLMQQTRSQTVLELLPYAGISRGVTQP